MKIIISESRLQGVFDTYLKSEHSHLYNLSKVPLRDKEDNQIYGYEFLEPEDEILMYFQYIIENPGYGHLPDGEKYPMIIPSQKLMKELRGMFGGKSYDLIKTWFQQTYQLPVKWVKTRDPIYFSDFND